MLWIGGWCAAALWLYLGVLMVRRRVFSETWLMATGLLMACAACLGIDAVVEVSSFPLLSPGAMAEAYPLWIAFVALVWIGFLGRRSTGALEAGREETGAVDPGGEGAA